MTDSNQRRRRSASPAYIPTAQELAMVNNQQRNRSFMQRGAVGMQRSQEETAAAAERQAAMRDRPFQPMRFWLNQGEEAQVVILDRSMNDIVFMHEHNFRNPRTGTWDGLELCPKEFEPCPVCDGRLTGQSEHPYYAMFLSVIDTRGYTKKDNTRVPFTRKLLVVKRAQHSQFFELLNSMQEQNKTIRGMVLKLSRGNESQSSRTGEPKIVSQGRMYGAISERKIQDTFIHPPITNKDGDILVPANGQQQPFVYSELFTAPSERAICARWNLPVPHGSSSMSNNEVFGSGGGVGGLDLSDDIPVNGRGSGNQNNGFDDDLLGNGQSHGNAGSRDVNGFSGDDFDDDLDIPF